MWLTPRIKGRIEGTAIQGCGRTTEGRSRMGIYRIRRSRGARERMSLVDVRQHYYKLHGDMRQYDFYRRIIGQADELFAVVRLVAGITYPRIARYFRSTCLGFYLDA